jgi:oligopeptide/dipeptide ABC transporter ATP-binding protein
MSDVLVVSGLRTYFHTRSGVVRAVDGVDLTLREGRILGLVGESGSGKSVFALSVMGLVDRPGRIEPESEIHFCGRNLATADNRELRRIRGNELSMIFQEPMTSLNPVYSIGRQMVEAIKLHLDVDTRTAHERVIEMLELVGIPSPSQRFRDYPHQMSGGMRQRVMIAMALVCEPKLLLADEPTTALDVTIQAQVLELLRDIRDRMGLAMVLITHDLSVVAEMCDDVAVMYAGRVVERGSVEDVFRDPQHPYTEALLRSIPALRATHAVPLEIIPGAMPEPLDRAPGCRFAPRCKYVFDECNLHDPPLFPLPATERGSPVGSDGGMTQASACWLRRDGRSESSNGVEQRKVV